MRGTVGVYYAEVKEESSRSITGTFPDPFGDPTLTYSLLRNDGYANKFENFALFGEAEFDLTDEWTVIAGGRYDREDGDRSEFAVTDVTPDFPFLPDGSTNFSGSSTFDAFLPKLSLIHHLNDDVSLSITAQRAYRPGGADIRPDTNEAVEFDPEYTNNFDLALRSIWMDGVLTLNANLFYVDYTDMQLRFAPDPAVPLVRFIDNAGEAELYGLEVESSYQPSSQLSLYASVALLESELKEFQFQGQDLSGQGFPASPDLSVSFGGTYRWYNGASVTLDNIFTGDYYSSLTDEQNSQVDSHFVSNLRLGYEQDGLTLFGYVSNLFDEEYVTRSFTDQAVPANSSATLGQPRTAGVGVEFRF
jgi:outer membrane receptor protein involved in Fe transport